MGSCLANPKRKTTPQREIWKAPLRESQEEDITCPPISNQRKNNQEFENHNSQVDDEIRYAPPKCEVVGESETEVKNDDINKNLTQQGNNKLKNDTSEEDEESRESFSNYSYSEGHDNIFKTYLNENMNRIQDSISHQLSNDILGLVQDFTLKYQPKSNHLDSQLKPFMPDYIPVVDTVDPFIKPPRPDRKYEKVGLTILDVPNRVNFPDALQQGYNDLLEQYMQEESIIQSELLDEKEYEGDKKSSTEIQNDKIPLAKQKSQDAAQLPKVQIMCKICFAKESNSLFIPCGHLGACEECAEQIIKSTSRCPFDNQKVTGFNKVFIA